MKRQLEFCGEISFQNEKYQVWLESPDGSVWVSKPSDKTFGFGNYNKFRASTRDEANQTAMKMLESVFGDP
jgi:hypothetical protein